MKVVERIIDGGFEAPIKRNMDVDEYEVLVERALDGFYAAKTTYLERLFEVVREVDEDLYGLLLHKVILYGPDKGVEEFLEDVEDMVLLFENEVLGRLCQHVGAGFPTMEEPVEVELEDPVLEENPQAQDIVFRFWAPGGGAEPVAEFTVLSDVEFLVAASQMDYLRRVVEDTLHDLKRKKEGGD